MEEGRILNHQITASSDGWWLPEYYKAKDARLKVQSLSWVCSYMDSTPWLQVSFAPEIKLISGIATQGNPSHDWWTTSYTLKHSMTGKTWQEHERQGFTEASEMIAGVYCGNAKLHIASLVRPRSSTGEEKPRELF